MGRFQNINSSCPMLQVSSVDSVVSSLRTADSNFKDRGAFEIRAPLPTLAKFQSLAKSNTIVPASLSASSSAKQTNKLGHNTLRRLSQVIKGDYTSVGQKSSSPVRSSSPATSPQHRHQHQQYHHHHHHQHHHHQQQQFGSKEQRTRREHNNYPPQFRSIVVTRLWYGH